MKFRKISLQSLLKQTKDTEKIKENYEKLLKKQQKKLSFNGRKLENGDYIVNSFLLGQLGKNFNKNILEEDKIKGVELLTIAYNLLIEIKNLINVKYLWIECEDNKKLLDFYSNFGFKLIENYVSNNGLKVMILKLEN